MNQKSKILKITIIIILVYIAFNILSKEEKIVAKAVKELRENSSSINIIEVRYYKQEKSILIDYEEENTKCISMYTEEGEFNGKFTSDYENDFFNKTKGKSLAEQYAIVKLDSVAREKIENLWLNNNNYVRINHKKILRNLFQVAK